MRLIDADELERVAVTVDGRLVVHLTDIHNAPTVPIQRAVWELYERYQPRLATNVYEFGVELKELLGSGGGRK